MAIRVVLGEDSYLVREGVRRALAAISDVELERACDDLPSLRAAVDELAPDVVVTDIRMPPTNRDEGIRLANELRSSHPEVGVVVLTQHADPLYAIALFEQGSGGRAYLLKERVSSPQDLSRALHEVSHGGSVVDERIVDALLEVRRQRPEPQLSALTPRELEILGLIAEGWSNTAIAQRLVVSRRAVEGHIGRIFAKLDLGETEDVSRRVRAALLYLGGHPA